MILKATAIAAVFMLLACASSQPDSGKNYTATQQSDGTVKLVFSQKTPTPDKSNEVKFTFDSSILEQAYLEQCPSGHELVNDPRGGAAQELSGKVKAKLVIIIRCK